jgi:hypothetical protein
LARIPSANSGSWVPLHIPEQAGTINKARYDMNRRQSPADYARLPTRVDGATARHIARRH